MSNEIREWKYNLDRREFFLLMEIFKKSRNEDQRVEAFNGVREFVENLVDSEKEKTRVGKIKIRDKEKTEYFKRYREERKEQIKKYKAEYYKKNKEAIKERVKQYDRKKREEKRLAKQREEDLERKLKQTEEQKIKNQDSMADDVMYHSNHLPRYC